MYGINSKGQFVTEEVTSLLQETRQFLLDESGYQIDSGISLKPTIDLTECCFFKLVSLTYDKKVPYREAFENVISTLENEAFNFVYLLSGDASGVTIYIGIANNYKSKNESNLSAVKYGRKVEAAFLGNFQGSELQKLDRDEIEEQIFKPLQDVNRASIVTGIPSINSLYMQKDLDFQGIDRLVTGMLNMNWKLLIVAAKVNNEAITSLQDELYSLYETLHANSTMSYQKSQNSSEGMSMTETEGDSRSITKGSSESKSNSASSGKSSGNSDTRGISNSATEGNSTSLAKGKSSTVGTSNAVTVEVINKKVQEMLKYIDENLLERMKMGLSKGLYKTSMYVLGENYEQHDRLKSNVLSIFQGDKSTFSPLKIQSILYDDKEELTKILCNFQTYEVKKKRSKDVALLYGLPYYNDCLGLSSFMTAKELSLIAALPQKEVVGLPLIESVEFGLNFKQTNVNKKDAVMLGSLIQRGRVQKGSPIFITKQHLNKHIFIAGVTGSGKTTTCQKLLIESQLPFLVIEPAKTEYRGIKELPGMDDLVIFTLGNEKMSPFRLNPFEFSQGESITSHIDILKATFTAAFPMEAAMPQILESALYRCYEQYGWDFTDDTNEYCESPWTSYGEYFPTLNDLVVNLETVVNEQGFGNELRQNYIGSLVSRISNLTVGAKGKMLNCHLSIDFNELLEKKVIIEMEDIKSPEDKSLLMGLILARMSVALKMKHKKNKHYAHITLIEEAHRLLSKIEIGDVGSKKIAVEMFTDMLAEVRKYGEGLIVVDQIPNKLAIEVLKNTNTKIIHKIFARDDKEAIGDTMLMNDKQKQYLSSLQVGEAILFTEGFHKPIHAAIDQLTNTSDNELEENKLKAIGDLQKEHYLKSFHPLLYRLNLTLSHLQETKSLFKQYKKTKKLQLSSRLTQIEWQQFVEKLEHFGKKFGQTVPFVWEAFCLHSAFEDGTLKSNHFDVAHIQVAAKWCFEQLSINVIEIELMNNHYKLIIG
ncbi:ATP-binding protein [Bacillus anthracis]|uniref:ATP-binding protein n=1 Tax=Bacillus anthracis TaxID=1392 RepID=UPI002DB65E97|nr:ATP-binding protein [Bacillus anthracis]MEB9458424.1 ATP-binding protein [Bacillus anthracis]